MEQMTVTQEMLDTFLITNKLDFEVEMTPQYIKTPHGEINNAFCPVRTDTYEPLSRGGMSEDFVPIQNRDAFRILTELSGVRDISLRNGGIWGGGAGVFAQISLGDMFIGNHSDQVGKYLSIVNSHDGTRALNVLITPYRYFCANQIAASVNHAQKVAGTFLSIRHNASAEQKLEELIHHTKIADGVFQETQEVYNKMATIKINEEYVKETLNRMFPINEDAGKRALTNWKQKIQGVRNRFYDSDGGRADTFTAWNLYNAVQGTLQHDSRNSIGKPKSILMGDIAKESGNALTTVLEICAHDHLPQSVMSEIDMLTQ